MSASTEFELRQPGVFQISISGTVDYDISETKKSVPATSVRFSLWVGGSQVSGAEFDVTLPPVLNFAGLLVGEDLDGTDEKYDVEDCPPPDGGGGGSSGGSGGSSGGSGGGSECGTVTIKKIPAYKQTPSSPMAVSGTWVLTAIEKSSGVHILSGGNKLRPFFSIKAQVMDAAKAPDVFPFKDNWETASSILVKVTRIQVTVTPLPIS